MSVDTLETLQPVNIEKSGNVPQVRSVKLKKKKRSKRKKEIIFIATIMTIPILMFFGSLFYTNIYSIILSFQDFNFIEGKYVFVGWANYESIIKSFGNPNSVFPLTVLNSLMYFLLNNFILLPLSLIFAFLLTKRMPLANLFRVIFFLPSIISMVVLTMVWTFMFDSSIGFMDSILKALNLGHHIPKFGWFGSYGSAQSLLLLYCFWVGIGGNILLVTGAIKRIPDEIFEAGKLEGLTTMKEFWLVVLPLIGSTVSVIFMVGITSFFTLFLQPKLITNGAPLGKTGTIAMTIINSIRENGNLTTGAAIGTLLTIVAIPVVFGFRGLLDKVFPEHQY